MFLLITPLSPAHHKSPRRSPRRRIDERLDNLERVYEVETSSMQSKMDIQEKFLEESIRIFKPNDEWKNHLTWITSRKGFMILLTLGRPSSIVDGGEIVLLSHP